jgi:prepilin-type N-terminal cleavage/methylation domain-containing protein
MRTPTSRAGTCPSNGSALAAPGFTILEMLVVLAVIGIIAVVALPRVGLLDSAELRAAGRNVAGTVRLTYSSAVMSRTPYRMVFDLGCQCYWIEKRSGDKYVKADDPLLARRELPESVMIKRVQAMDRDCSGQCQQYIYFTPGGYVEEASIYLATANEDNPQVVSVFTQPMTGRADVVSGEISREEWEKQGSSY